MTLFRCLVIDAELLCEVGERPALDVNAQDQEPVVPVDDPGLHETVQEATRLFEFIPRRCLGCLAAWLHEIAQGERVPRILAEFTGTHLLEKGCDLFMK